MPKFPEEYANCGSGGALAVARMVSDGDVAQFIDAWVSFPAAIRRGIMAMVQEVTRE